jgi:AraC-like DNA-binding protein
MDPLGDLLNGARARNALLHRVVLEPPWSIRVEEAAPLTLVALVRGTAWIVAGDAAGPVRLGAGDVAIVRGEAPYTVADDPATPPTIVVHPGGDATTPAGEDLGAGVRRGPRTCDMGRGGGAGGAVVVSGTYNLHGDVSGRLLAALPRVLIVAAADGPRVVMDLLVRELDRDDPGQQVVLDRALDLALIDTLRAWFARPEARPPGWYRALGDPLVGPALRLLHDRPADPWTVESLADAVAASRAAFARRFTELVGEPPMTYLARWRVDLAADLLRTTDAKLDAVARRVGYASGYALSAAFTRLRGVRPGRLRAARTSRIAATAER